MNYLSFLESLLECGRANSKSALLRGIRSTTPALDRAILGDVHLPALIAFTKSLSPNEQIVFLKVIAVVEEVIGGLGSATSLSKLLPLLSEANRRNALDWVLRNTQSYGYYCLGAKSIEEYEAILIRKTQRTAENIQRDSERQAKDKARIANTASSRLYNAVRRGDSPAVRALLRLGASPRGSAPDGTLLRDVARANKNEPIVEQLEAAASELLKMTNDD